MDSSHGYLITVLEDWECLHKKSMSQMLKFMEQVNVQSCGGSRLSRTWSK